MSGYGMKSHVMTNFQNSYGTAFTGSLTAVSIVNESIVHGIETIREAGMYGRMSQSPAHQGLFSVTGDLTAEASPDSLGWFLSSVVGAPTTTSGTNTQTHVYKPQASDFDGLAATTPLTMEISRDVGSAGLYSDLCGNTLSLGIANGELLTTTLGVVGGAFTKQVASSPTFPTAKPFKWDQMSGSFNGAAITDIQDMTININNNLEARHTLVTSGTPQKIKRTAPQVIELSGTMLFQSHSYWTAWESGNEFPFVVNFAGAETPNNLKIDVPKMRLTSFDPVVGGAGIVTAAFAASAEFSTTSNTAIEITLVNTVAGY